MSIVTSLSSIPETKPAAFSPRRSAPLSVAIVGAGYIAGYHLEVLRGVKSVQVVGACDPDATRLNALCRQWGVPHGSRTLTEMLEECTPDAVHLLVPPPYHFEVAQEALQAGVHVLVEKPMTLRGEECQQLIETAHANQVHLGVNHNSLYHPPYRRLQADVQAGKLGRIQHVVSINNLPLAQLQSGQHDHWMFRAPENVLLEQGPHPLAQICGLLGAVRRAETIGLNEKVLRTGNRFISNWQVSLECERGTAQLFMAFGQSFPLATLQVIGQDGSAQIDLINDVYTIDRPTPRVAPLDSMIRRLTQGRQLAGCGLRNFGRYGLSLLRLAPRSDAYYHSMRDSIEAFYAEIARGERTSASAESGRLVIQGIELAAASVKRRDDVGPAAATRRLASPAPRNGDILVLGGTGFIGRRLVAALVASGKPVRMLVRTPTLLPKAAREGEASVVVGDACDPEAVDRAVQGCQAVIHLVAGAPANWPGFERLFVEGTRQVAEACLRHDVQQLLFASSICALYLGRRGVTVNDDTPIDPYPEKRCDYARAKILCERLLMEMHRQRQLPVTILRPGIVIGDGSSFAHLGVGTWPALTHCVGWGRGSHGLPFVLVDDVVSAFAGALGNPSAAGKAFNLVGDVRISAQEYIDAVRRESGRDVRLHKRSVIAWKLLESLIWSIKAAARKPDNHAMSYRELAYRTAVSPIDCSGTKQVLGWQPVSDRRRFIELGIREALAETST